jgi:hypothetical protein
MKRRRGNKWAKEPIEAKTSRRAEICLNGIWQAMPAVNEEPYSSVSEYVQVDTSWATPRPWKISD